MSYSIDGLVSGLDTTSLIKQLMAVERQPQARLERRQSQMEKEVSALQGLNTKFAALSTAARELSTATKWNAFKATSSADSVLTVSASSTAQTGTLSFKVTGLAAAHAIVSSGTVASTSTVVAGGPLTITRGGTPSAPIDVGDGSLASVVDAVNRAGVGVRAAAVKVADGAYRLQLTSSTTGAASAFTVGGLNLPALGGAMNTVTAGADAVLEVGDVLAGGYSITSASNTVTGVLPGMTFNLRGTGNVTVDVSRDAEAVADKVKGMVDAANAALADIKKLTSYDAASKTSGLLGADGTVRRLQQTVVSAIYGIDGTSPSEFGVEVKRDGTVGFDRATFLAKYAEDPDAVRDRFAQVGSSTSGSLSFVSSTVRTKPGTYDINVTAAATSAGTVGGVVAGGGTLQNPETIEIQQGTRTATYNAAAGADVDTVASGLNTAFRAAGLSLVASNEGGALAVRAESAGTAGSFTVLQAGAGPLQTGLALGANSGTDVSGTFELADGTIVAGTGKGNLLVAPSDHAVLGGLGVRVTTGAFGALGSLTYETGLAQRLDMSAAGVTDRTIGSLTLAIKGRQERAQSLDRQIESWDIRLALRESALKRQFSGLETALSGLRNQSSWLAGQLSTL